MVSLYSGFCPSFFVFFSCGRLKQVRAYGILGLFFWIQVLTGHLADVFNDSAFLFHGGQRIIVRVLAR